MKVNKFLLLMSCYIASLSYGGVYLLIKYTQIVLNGTVLEFGYFLFVSGIVTILFVGISGSLSKKYGANIISSYGILLFGLGFGILYLINDINIFYYIAAFLIGLGWSFYYASSPMIILTDAIEEKEKGVYVSLISVAVVLGTSTLPVLYDFCNTQNNFLKDIYMYTFLISLIGGSLFYHLNKYFPSNKENIKIEFKSLEFKIWQTDAYSSFIMVFLGACIFSTMMLFQLEYAEERDLTVAIFFIFYSISVILSRILFSGILNNNNPIRFLPWIVSLMSLGLIVMIFNYNNNYLYMISASLIGISYGLAYPLIKTYAIKTSKLENRHQAIAFFTLSYFVGVYFFPLIASILFVGFSTNGYLLLLLFISIAYVGVSSSIQKKSMKYYGDYK